jgi:hypothetical protein
MRDVSRNGRHSRLLHSAAVVCLATIISGGVTYGWLRVTASSTPEGRPRSCSAAVPQFARATAAASVETRRPREVAYIRRDASGTLVGLCLRTPSLPRILPSLKDGGKRLRVNGARLILGRHNAVVLYFPPSTGRVLRALVGPETIAVARFASPPKSHCSLKADNGFRVIGCGAFVHVRWRTGLPIEARRVQLLDVGVRTPERDHPTLGFFLDGKLTTAKGLVVDFGFYRPRVPTTITIRLREIDLANPRQLLRPDRIVRFRLRPPPA